MALDHNLELPALVRSWEERGPAEVLRNWMPVVDGVEQGAKYRELRVPSTDMEGVEELEQKPDEGRRIVVDLGPGELAAVP
eukprot:gene946-18441_t